MSNFENPISDAKNSFSDIPQKVEPQNEVKKNKERQLKNIEIKIGENTYSLETASYDFEYPKRIQEETGIIGYERTKILNENIFDVFKDLNPAILERMNINSLEELSQKYQDLQIKDRDDSDRKDYYALNETIEKTMREVLSILSKGDYPNRCYNHKLGGFASDEHLGKMREHFRDDKLFLQKIYDAERIEKNINDGQDKKRVFNYPTSGNGIFPYSNFNLYEKISNSHIKEKAYIGEIIEHVDDLKDGNYFAATPSAGLNLAPGRFWHGADFSDICFGFASSDDSFLAVYIEKILDSFLEIEGKNIEDWYSKNESSHFLFSSKFRGIESAFLMYALNKYANRHGEIPSRIEQEDADKIILEEIEQIIGDFFKDKGTNNIFKEGNVSMSRLLACSLYNNYPLDGEIFLPIFIGHDEIPQLAWGHAKYAHYMNEKGFNFFKFRHADHLPKK